MNLDSWSGLEDGDGLTYAFDLPLDHDANLRRVKSLATVRPILDIERTKSQLQGDFWDFYDLVGVATATIDRVALAMGVSSGLSHADTVAAAGNEAARQQPVRKPIEHDAVAARVVEGLVTSDEFEHVYLDERSGEDTETVRRKWTWRLLYEQWAADETVYIRASEPAITVLLNALDVDPGSAQAAAEFQIRYLVERGMYETAVGVATQSRLRTAGYLERVSTIVRDTRIDPEAYDWIDDVPKLLDSALSHVSDRVHAEGELLEAIAERRDTANTAEARISANQLISVLGDCRDRHLELQAHLMDARAALRRSQDDRFASPLGSTTVDLERDLLENALRTPVGTLSPWSTSILNHFAAPMRSILPALSVLIDEALTAAPDDTEGDEAVTVDDLDFEDEAPPWWEPYWALVESLLEAVTETLTLSQLCARARHTASATDLDPLVAAAVAAHAGYALLAAPVDAAFGLLAVADTGRCDDPAVTGTELTITPWVTNAESPVPVIADAIEGAAS